MQFSPIKHNSKVVIKRERKIRCKSIPKKNQQQSSRKWHQKKDLKHTNLDQSGEHSINHIKINDLRRRRSRSKFSTGESRERMKRYRYLESCWSGGISWTKRLEKSLRVLARGSRHGWEVWSSVISSNEEEQMKISRLNVKILRKWKVKSLLYPFIKTQP